MARFLRQDTLSIIKESDILFDTSAIIDILRFEAESLMKDLVSVNAQPCYIHQVLLELMATDTFQHRTARQIFLNQYRFNHLVGIDRFIKDKAIKLQEQLHQIDCHPSPTDLYLGACLDHYSTAGSRTFLLTSNVRDFPSTIFHKVDFVILEGIRDVKVLSLISLGRYRKISQSIEDKDLPF